MNIVISSQNYQISKITTPIKNTYKNGIKRDTRQDTLINSIKFTRSDSILLELPLFNLSTRTLHLSARIN